MKRAEVRIHNIRAGELIERGANVFTFQYDANYRDSAISLTMPVREEPYDYDGFPPFFDGLLPEGIQLDGLLRINKIDQYDYFEQMVATGADLVGAVTVHPIVTADE